MSLLEVVRMSAFIEREDFSKRLQLTLREAGYIAHSPTLLAREFNVRFVGRSITVHAARKWLQGEAIPTQEKLRVLAQWLGVAAEWLRFGGKESVQSATTLEISSNFDMDNIRLLSDLQRLDKSHQAIVREIVRLLLRMNIENARSSD